MRAWHKKMLLPVIAAMAALSFTTPDDHSLKSALAQQRESSFTDLTSIEELKSVFNADPGLVRLILLLSPT